VRHSNSAEPKAKRSTTFHHASPGVRSHGVGSPWQLCLCTNPASYRGCRAFGPAVPFPTGDRHHAGPKLRSSHVNTATGARTLTGTFENSTCQSGKRLVRAHPLHSSKDIWLIYGTPLAKALQMFILCFRGYRGSRSVRMLSFTTTLRR